MQTTATLFSNWLLLWTSHVTRCFGSMWAHNANGTSIGSAVFSQMTAECPYTLQWFVCFPLEIVPSHVGIRTSCNTWFIGPTRVRNANGNLIGSAIFGGFHSVTDWQSDRKTNRPRHSVRRIHGKDSQSLRYDTIRWSILTCAYKLTSSQLNLLHGTKQKNNEETKNKKRRCSEETSGHCLLVRAILPLLSRFLYV